MEALEARTLPSASVIASLSGGLLKITGTESADNIVVNENDGFAGSFISITNSGSTVKINVNGSLKSTVSLGSVSKIEVNALGGSDRVNLWSNSFAAVSVNSLIRGGSGDDVLRGGDGNDTIYGNAGKDWMSGYGGDDYLNGGTPGTAGATLEERDHFWGGSGWDKYFDGFDKNKWVYNGQSVQDVQQESTPTCQTLATLAAAVVKGIDFSSANGKITYQGNNVYKVKLYSNGSAVYENVTFDGTWSDNDPAPRSDSSGYIYPEFWTILMQRARLERFYSIFWNTKMTEADWDAKNRSSGNLYNTQTAIKQMHGYSTSSNRASTISTTTLRNALDSRKLMVASTGDSAGKKTLLNGTGIVSKHAYAVTSVYKSGSTWYVKVYNPWGTDTSGTPRDGVNDGNLTLTLSEFQKSFSTVYIQT